MEKKHLAGMALIAIGLLLLLSNLGLLPRDIWPQLLRFWPLILICTGLVLVDQKGRWGVYLSLALVVAVLAGSSTTATLEVSETCSQILAIAAEIKVS